MALIDKAEPSAFDASSAPDIRVSALSAGGERYLDSMGAAFHPGHARHTYRRLAVWDETPNPLSRLLPPSLTEVEFSAEQLGARHLGHIVENSITQQALWQRSRAGRSLITGRSVQDPAINNWPGSPWMMAANWKHSWSLVQTVPCHGFGTWRASALPAINTTSRPW